MVVIDKDIKTIKYYKGIMSLLCASHWVDTETGEQVKLPQGIKTYYQYRQAQYNKFLYHDLPYFESNKHAAEAIGTTLDTVAKTYNPILKRMNLLCTVGEFKDNNVCYIINGLDSLKGVLINKTLKTSKVEKREFNNDSDFTYDNLKVLESNKKLASRISKESNNKLCAIPTERLQELLKLEREHNGNH